MLLINILYWFCKSTYCSQQSDQIKWCGDKENLSIIFKKVYNLCEEEKLFGSALCIKTHVVVLSKSKTKVDWQDTKNNRYDNTRTQKPYDFGRFSKNIWLPFRIFIIHGSYITL